AVITVAIIHLAGGTAAMAVILAAAIGVAPAAHAALAARPLGLLVHTAELRPARARIEMAAVARDILPAHAHAHTRALAMAHAAMAERRVAPVVFVTAAAARPVGVRARAPSHVIGA